MRIRLVALLLSAVQVLSGCASKEGESSAPTLSEIASDPQGELDQSLRLRAGDTLEIRLGGVPKEEIEQVTGTYTVDTEGFVNMPQVGRVQAAGETQQALQSAVEAAYRDKGIYSNPTVTVTVPFTARFVNIGGEVRQPQRVPYTPDLTVLSAITAAGGFTEFASQSRVKLYRHMEVLSVDMRKIRKDPGKDIPLQPGDTIEVMRTFF